MKYNNYNLCRQWARGRSKVVWKVSRRQTCNGPTFRVFAIPDVVCALDSIRAYLEYKRL